MYNTVPLMIDDSFFLYHPLHTQRYASFSIDYDNMQIFFSDLLSYLICLLLFSHR